MTTTWNAADEANLVLSNGDLTASNTGGSSGGVRSTSGHTIGGGGKFYFEFSSITMTSGNDGIGMATLLWALTNTSNSNDIISHVTFGSVRDGNGGSTGLSDGDPSGHVLGIAVDLVNNNTWWRIDNNGWNNDVIGHQNPTLNVGGIALGTPNMNTGTLFIAAALVASGDTVTLNAVGGFANPAPSGFTAWDTPTGPSGTWASTEAPDAWSAVGWSVSPGEVANWTSLEGTDSFSGAGYPLQTISFITTEAPDTFSGFVDLPFSAAWASTEAPDDMAFAGIGYGETLLFPGQENADIASFVATVPQNAEWASTEAADRFLALGVGVTRPQRRVSFFVT